MVKVVLWERGDKKAFQISILNNPTYHVNYDKWQAGRIIGKFPPGQHHHGSPEKVQPGVKISTEWQNKRQTGSNWAVASVLSGGKHDARNLTSGCTKS